MRRVIQAVAALVFVVTLTAGGLSTCHAVPITFSLFENILAGPLADISFVSGQANLSADIESLDDFISASEDQVTILVDYDDGDEMINMFSSSPLTLSGFKLSDAASNEITLGVKSIDVLGTRFTVSGEAGEGFFEWVPGTDIAIQRNADFGDSFDGNKGNLVASARIVLEPTSGSLIGFNPTSLEFTGEWDLQDSNNEVPLDILRLGKSQSVIPEPGPWTWLCWGVGCLAFIIRRQWAPVVSAT